MEEETKKITCSSCRRNIDFGSDVISAEIGVNGPRGIVPLSEKLYFCREQCVGDYFDRKSRDRPKVKPRIP
jgi:hypothetical protein